MGLFLYFCLNIILVVSKTWILNFVSFLLVFQWVDNILLDMLSSMQLGQIEVLDIFSLWAYQINYFINLLYNLVIS